MGLLVLYTLTFFDEFRYFTVTPNVKVTDRVINDGMSYTHNHARAGGFVPSSTHSSRIRNAGGINSTPMGRYIYGPRGDLVWVPSKGL